ncbi:hypothetical protein D3C87_1678950 [compost metagenome]
MFHLACLRVHKELIDRKKRRFRIECIENRFHKQQIAATVGQAFYLLVIGFYQLIEADRAETRIVHIR